MVRGEMLSDPGVYALALVAALCIGLSKAGFSGISMVSIVLLADIYGPKASVGLALPLLIAADLMAYPAFIRHGSWRPVVSTVVGFPRRSIERRGTRMLEVGLSAMPTTTSCPVAIPPSVPPA